MNLSLSSARFYTTTWDLTQLMPRNYVVRKVEESYRAKWEGWT